MPRAGLTEEEPRGEQVLGKRGGQHSWDEQAGWNGGRERQARLGGQAGARDPRTTALRAWHRGNDRDDPWQCGAPV